MLLYFKANIDTYVQGKKFYWYIPAWFFGIYLFVEIVGFSLGGEVSFLIAIPQAFDFFLHEMAHLFTAFLPHIWVAFAGSGAELLLGLSLIVGAILTRCYFALLFCSLWFMLATQSVADYIADARAQSLPLVSFGGGDPIHDWHFILNELGLLQQDQLLANMLRGFGIIVAVATFIFTAWLIWRMGSFVPHDPLKEKPKATDVTLELGVPEIPESAAKSPELYPTPLVGPLGAHEPPEDKKRV